MRRFLKVLERGEYVKTVMRDKGRQKSEMYDIVPLIHRYLLFPTLSLRSLKGIYRSHCMVGLHQKVCGAKFFYGFGRIAVKLGKHNIKRCWETHFFASLVNSHKVICRLSYESIHSSSVTIHSSLHCVCIVCLEYVIMKWFFAKAKLLFRCVKTILLPIVFVQRKQYNIV